MIETAGSTTATAHDPSRGQMARGLVWRWLLDRDWSATDFLAVFGDYNGLVEIVDGRLVIHDMPGTQHQTIVLNLAVALRASSAGRVFIAALPVRLSDETVREPDVLFVATAHLDRVHETYIDPPDLAIEVISPGRAGRRRDLLEKRSEYARAGIGEYWIVDPKARDILVLRLDAGGSAPDGSYAEIGRFSGDDVVTAEAAPDVPIRVADVFAQAAAGDSATR